MKTLPTYSGCSCCSMSRRDFLAAAGCGAACAGVLGALSTPAPVRAFATGAKFRVRILFALHADVQPRPDWPNIGYDFRPVMERTTTALRQGCPEFEFVTATATGPEETAKIVEADKTAEIDGYIVVQMNCWNRVVQTVVATGKPTIYSDFLYAGSGGFLVYNAGFLRAGVENYGFVSSQRLEDLVAAARCFDVIRKGGTVADFTAATAKVRHDRTKKPDDMQCKPDEVDLLPISDCLEKVKGAKILAVEKGWLDLAKLGTDATAGIECVNVPFAEVNAAWEAADRDQSIEIAERWQKAAKVIQDVERETLIKSAAMYLAQKEVMKKHGAIAITINCLGGFYGGHIHAYPCLGFHELLNEGLIGACECDTRSTFTMAMVNALTNGRPGYISDPVIDTSTNQVIYAHCVATNKPFGPQGPANPFEILTHSEDRQGAAVRSILPVGYMTTSLEFAPDRKQILFHQAKAVDNIPEDRACRTKLAAEPVGDIEKLFGQWDRWGWHRVTYYGDLKEPIFALADALGWEVLEEA
ncbi:MAG: twin-arginine translocation signal domain-containing protein [Thermoguttaceae bacterium]|jgi:hypothetical protein|nr:twin-arginine translocation signal domain-containing protein [Thermoguttaceae bacterium]